MKRLFNLFLLLTMFVVKAMATDYPIVVKGVTVTSSNASNVLGNGTVSYTASTNTLTLKNANIKKVNAANSYYAIYYNGGNSLNIKLVGDNYLEGYDTHGGFGSISGDICIIGDGNLTLKGISVDEINNVSSSGNLTIKEKAKVNLQPIDNSSHAHTIRGTLSVLENATLYVERMNWDYPSFSSIGDFVKSSNHAIYPNTITFNREKHNFVDKNNEKVHEDILISIPQNYMLSIGDNQLHEYNAVDVYGDGKVSYNDATKTLTLNNANLSGVCDVIHDYDYNETITINLIGNNTIKADYDALSSDGASYIITGDGTLNINGINLDEGNLTIKGNAKVNVLKSNFYAIDLRGADLSVLDNAELNVKGNGKDETFWGIGKLTLSKGFLVHPIKLSYSSTKQSIVDDAGNRTKGDIKIYNANSLKKYALEIEGVQLNEFNASDPCGDGSVKYDDATWTLTLNNANLSGVSDVITDYRDDLSWLNIVLKGTNTVKANLTALRTDGSNVTIKGDGTLNVNGINLDEGNLAIRESAKVNVLKSNFYAINLRGANLTVLDNSELTVEGNGKDETVWGIKNLYLEDGYAVSPKNISYSSTKQTFVDENGNATKGDIKIAQAPYDPSADLYDLWIAGTQVSAANANDVFGDGTVKVTKGNADIYIRLNGANLMSSSTAQKGVIYSTSDISVGCFGYCRIEAQGDVNAAIYSEKHVKVYGSALIKGLWNGICAKSVVIDYGNIDIEGLKGRGICGFWGDQEGSLKFDYTSPSVLKVKGGIEDFAEITFGDETMMEADADICVYDFGSKYDHNYSIVTDDSQHNLYREEITISYGPSGHLYLYSDDYRGIISDSFTRDIGTGAISYDKESKTITLNNCGYACGFNSYVDGLTIKLIGYTGFSAELHGDTRIIGDGINMTKLPYGIASRPIGKDVNISIEDVIINENEIDCLFDFEKIYSGSDVNLKLVNCSINARLEDYAHLHTPIIFEGCKFSGYSEEPKFDSEKGTYLNSSGQPLTTYRIAPTVATGITDLQTTATDAPAYDLMGRKVNSNYRGIVIKNGQKMMVK